ncbi:MAG: 50S ribosomal protein L6 [Acidimicrobiia bacterium]|nr:50S ribosomal protein L6 [bacterium]MXX45348.1 50S ribosomal protein L6 [Acidimicrobiia bacterium]MYA39870.1 50S ribosomal protein L6 [Acidimicrobiia bacterium]MYD40398.1 50S ribosomal protein L6 [Acidimicrobiia bacterium]MYG91798.1 50S ribosomal protein L6 [Acidimicrobiia bacterium]
MSRVGMAPITIPPEVDLAVDGSSVVVKGPMGELSRTFHERVRVDVSDSQALVSRVDESRMSRALHGLSRTLLANMVTGVLEGYQKELTVVGVGYRAQSQGDRLVMQLGFSHPVEIAAPEGVTFETPAPTRIIVKGIDKQKVGHIAADIRRVRPPEPYKGKGIRYADEKVRRKAGKAGRI